jgi:hypothetical protein
MKLVLSTELPTLTTVRKSVFNGNALGKAYSAKGVLDRIKQRDMVQEKTVINLEVSQPLHQGNTSSQGSGDEFMDLYLGRISNQNE